VDFERAAREDREVAVENDLPENEFLSGALGKAGLMSAKR
jgi:hypothetical protein